MANVLDFYLDLQKDEELIASKEYQLFKDNKLDTAILDGVDPDPGAGIVHVGKEISDGEKSILMDDVVDFVKSMPKDLLISVTRGAMNGFDFVNSTTNLVGVNPDSSYEFIRDKIDNQLKRLDELDKDSPLVSKLIAIAGQDGAYVYPAYKKFKSLGIPKQYALPLAFGTGQALAFDKEASFLIDTDSINSMKKYIGIEPNTAADDTINNALLAIEGASLGILFDKLGIVLKGVKNSNWQQNAVAVGGGTASGAIVDKAMAGEKPSAEEAVTQFQLDNLKKTDQNLNIEEPTQNIDEEKKTLNQSSSLQDTDNMYASAGFGPVFFSMVREAAKKIPNKGSGQQLFNTIKNTKGVKETELKWTGLDDFLKDKKSVTKQEIQEYLQNNTLDVAEITLPRTSVEADNFKNILNTIKRDRVRIFKELKALPENQGRMIDTYSYKLTNTLEEGSKFNESVSTRTLDDIFIGPRISSYIKPITNIKSNRDYFDKKKLMDEYGKEDNKNILEFFMFENDKTGVVHAYPKSRINVIKDKPDPLSDGVFRYSYKTEMNIKEAEKYALNTTMEKLEKAIKQTSSDTKFGTSSYTEVGGKDYTELVFKLKGDRGYPVEVKATDLNLQDKIYKTESPYRSPGVHFGTKNEIAHVRFKTRDLNGQKVLTVEEMQSDIVQDMKKGITTNNVQDFPFKNNWYELVIKRLLRYAADNNFDAVAIPKANPIMKRYKQDAIAIDNLNIKVIRHPRGSMFLDEKDGATSLFPKDAEKPALYRFVVNYKEGNKLRKSLVLDEKEIFETLDGYKVSDSVRKQVNEVLENKAKFVADELTIDAPITKMIVGSGKGKVQLYNQAIPSFMKKYGKKWNAKVYDDKINTREIFVNNKTDQFETIPVTIIKLTDEMKQSIQQDGQALFSILGLGVGSKIASDSIENNIISETTNK